MGIFFAIIFLMDVLDSNLQNPTRTAYLNTCCIANFYGFLCGMTKKNIISRVCCFQLCMLTQCIGLWLLYVKRTGLLYMTHSLQEYTSGQPESDIWYIAWIFTAAQSCFTFPSVERQTGIVLMTPPLSFLVHQWREKDFQALNPTTTIRQTGVDLPRQQWSLLNRFHAAQISHCAACRKRWYLTDLDLCSMAETQTMSHITISAIHWAMSTKPLTKLNGGLSRLHSADDDAVQWLANLWKVNPYMKEKEACSSRTHHDW